MKYLHTADIHLDCKFSGIQDIRKRQRRRQEHRDTFRRIIDVGLEKGVDVVFIVGDLFEQNSFSLDTIRFIQREFARLRPTPILIAPGNHDPLIHGSPYLLGDWGEHVHIFHKSQFTPYSLDDYDAIVYGIAHTFYQDKKNYLKEFTVADTNKLNIILLHGSDTNVIPEIKCEEVYFPFTRDDLFNCGANYIALGHYHHCRFLEDQPIAAYPGSPEGMNFSERGKRYVIVGEVTKDGNQLQKIIVNQREYRDLEWNCSDCTTREEVLDGICQMVELDGLSKHILRIRLIGMISPDIDLNLSLMQETLNKFCFQSVLVNETYPKWDIDDLKEQPNVRGEFVRELTEMIQEAQGEKKELYQAAMNYGLEALSDKQEVTLR